MEAIQAETLPAQATIYRITQSSDGYGGTTETETLLGTIPCDYARKSGIERFEGEQVQGLGDWILTFEVGTDIQVNDRVVIDNRNFEIAAVYAFVWATAVQAEANEQT
jgi:head-tail adaptor